MIKASGKTEDGKPVVLVGLSGESVTRLAADEPIQFSLAELGLDDIKLVIMYGKTEAEITRQLIDAGLLPESAV